MSVDPIASDEPAIMLRRAPHRANAPAAPKFVAILTHRLTLSRTPTSAMGMPIDAAFAGSTAYSIASPKRDIANATETVKTGLGRVSTIAWTHRHGAVGSR